MFELLNQGGPVFMYPLALMALAVFALAAQEVSGRLGGEGGATSHHRILQIGVFSFFFGLLGQFLGLYEAFVAIEMMGDVAPGMLAGGLKVAMLSFLFGLIILILAALLWFFIDIKKKRATT